MAKTYQYCVAENWGKGFIDHVESQRITFCSFPGNVWQVPAYNKHGNLWIAKVAGVVKTRMKHRRLLMQRSHLLKMHGMQTLLKVKLQRTQF
ncbi:MAG: hypothetical protein CM15mV60_440 [uncultured marine virus]|nr:MAG: hypothetical protein CM15mV60_440 [uncultured marine virus]